MSSARDIAFVGCRLLALYFLYFALTSLPHSFWAVSSAFDARGAQAEAFFYEAALWLSFASPILNLVMVLVLWFGAGWLSKEVAEGAPEATSTWSPQSLLSVGVVLLGLVLVSFALPQIVWHLLYLADDAERENVFRIFELASAILRFVIGIGLILGADYLAKTITYLRRWSAERPQA
jgi:hypothetical protein